MHYPGTNCSKGVVSRTGGCSPYGLLPIAELPFLALTPSPDAAIDTQCQAAEVPCSNAFYIWQSRHQNRNLDLILSGGANLQVPVVAPGPNATLRVQRHRVVTRRRHRHDVAKTCQHTRRSGLVVAISQLPAPVCPPNPHPALQIQAQHVFAACTDVSQRRQAQCLGRTVRTENVL